MINHLELTNIGAYEHIHVDFAPRLNILTGDNGLGKSFLLDVAWWALTRSWPAQLNAAITAGSMARPKGPGKSSISFNLDGKDSQSVYNRNAEEWPNKQGRPMNPGMVLYAMADGSFAIWDPVRNYWRKAIEQEGESRPRAYVFDPLSIMNGLKKNNSEHYCNGLIRDLPLWQLQQGEAWEQISEVMETLSPPDEPISFGKPSRLSLYDVRDIPTIQMPYRIEVPIIHASSAIKRMLSLAYCLAWAWQEHKKASELIGKPTTGNIIFLVDEIEAHLHPKWQRAIVSTLLNVMDRLTSQANVQLILTTHSPLVMSSSEDSFNEETDQWLDLDLEQGEIILSKRNFEKRGTAENWLLSKAFDLNSTRAPKKEALIKKATEMIASEPTSEEELGKMQERLFQQLGMEDPFYIRWSYLMQKKLGHI